MLAALDAGRGEIHAAIYDELAMTVYGPAVVTLEDAAGLARQHAATLAGSGGRRDRRGGRARIRHRAGRSHRRHRRHHACWPPCKAPAPRTEARLYLRQADAKPQAGFVLPREGADALPVLPAAPPRLCVDRSRPNDSKAYRRASPRGFLAALDRRRVRRACSTSPPCSASWRAGRQGQEPPAGFVLARLAAGEAEIFTVAVARAHRRQGIGWRLMDAVLRELHAQRAEALFLEVDEANLAALALYRRLGFHEVGKRPRYYHGCRRLQRRACHAPRSSLATRPGDKGERHDRRIRLVIALLCAAPASRCSCRCRCSR